MNESFSFHVQRYFVSYLMKQHNYGPNTIGSYRDTFRLLLEWLSAKGHKPEAIKVADVGSGQVVDFLSWLETQRHNAASTRNVRLAHIKSFFHYLLLNEPGFADHSSKVIAIPFAKVAKKPPECLSVAAVGALLHSVDASTPQGLRHLALLALLYDSGCRVQELIDLNVSDFQNGTCCRIYVHGKGDKYRFIPLLKETGKVIGRYIDRYRLSGDMPMFANTNGKRMTRQGVGYIIKKYAGVAEKSMPGIIDANPHPHILRHSKASHLVDNGVNIYNVRDFLGHESVATTQIYITSNPEVTRKAIEAAAEKTVPESAAYYSEEEKDELLAFLNSLG